MSEIRDQVLERFLRYVQIDTQSNEEAESYPPPRNSSTSCGRSSTSCARSDWPMPRSTSGAT